MAQRLCMQHFKPKICIPGMVYTRIAAIVILLVLTCGVRNMSAAGGSSAPNSHQVYSGLKFTACVSTLYCRRGASQVVGNITFA